MLCVEGDSRKDNLQVKFNWYVMSTPQAQQRKSIDCRLYPSEKNCTLKISGTEEEVLDAAVQHAVHGHEDTPELRQQIRSMKIHAPG
jgi:hypothetical protein